MTITATIAGVISMLANFAMFFGGDRDRPAGMTGIEALEKISGNFSFKQPPTINPWAIQR